MRLVALPYQLILNRIPLQGMGELLRANPIPLFPSQGIGERKRANPILLPSPFLLFSIDSNFRKDKIA